MAFILARVIQSYTPVQQSDEQMFSSVAAF
jgi:hypothetical protein